MAEPGATAEANLISLKDEYQSMAGDKLTGKTGYELPNINKNIEGWGTDAAGTDLTVGDKYADLINVKGAKFLDLYNSSSVKIDDADDLKDALKEYDVEMSIAFNDNPDNDEFRKAYIVVITGLEKKGTGGSIDNTGSVRFAEDYNTNGKKGTLTDTKIQKLGNGQVKVSFTLNKPDWAYGGNLSGTAHVRLDYQVLVDGVLYAETSAPTNNMFDTSAGALLTASTDGETYTLTDYPIPSPVLPANVAANASNITVEITKVDWLAARVLYEVNGQSATRASGASEYVATSALPSKPKFAVAGYAANTAGNWTVEGLSGLGYGGAVLPVSVYQNVATTDIGDSSLAANVPTSSILAKGDEFVVVNFVTNTTNPATEYNVTRFGKTGAKTYDIGTDITSTINITPAKAAPTTPTLAITPASDKVSGEAGKNNTYYTLTATTAGKGVVTGYEVNYTLTVGGVERDVDPLVMDFKNLNTVTETISVTNVDGDVDLVIDSVTPITYPAWATAYTSSAKQMTVTFNEAIELAADYGSKLSVTGAGQIESVGIVPDNDHVLVIIFKDGAALANGNVVDIDGAVVTEEGAAKQVQITVTTVGTPDVDVDFDFNC